MTIPLTPRTEGSSTCDHHDGRTSSFNREELEMLLKYTPVAGLAVAWLAGCSSDDNGGGGKGPDGGEPATGGGSASGGKTGSGGSTGGGGASSGGASTAGGASGKDGGQTDGGATAPVSGVVVDYSTADAAR